jgi:hypothetical protein
MKPMNEYEAYEANQLQALSQMLSHYENMTLADLQAEAIEDVDGRLLLSYGSPTIVLMSTALSLSQLRTA